MHECVHLKEQFGIHGIPVHEDRPELCGKGIQEGHSTGAGSCSHSIHITAIGYMHESKQS